MHGKKLSMAFDSFFACVFVSVIPQVELLGSATELKMVEKPSGPVSTGVGVFIKCETDSSNSGSPGTIFWYKDGQLITTGVTPSTRQASDGGTIYTSQLTFTAKKEDNQAKFECKINDQANFKKYVTITVYFHPSKITILDRPPAAVHENKLISIVCETDSANPAANIQFHRKRTGGTWQQMTSGITSEDRATEYIGTIRMSNLTLTANRLDNQAVFKCEVKYDSFQVEQTTKVNVYYPPSTIMSSSPNPVKEGDTLTLTCVASGGNPTRYNYKWFYRNEEKPKETFKEYKIKVVKYTQSGTYRCQAINYSPGGVADGSMNVDVLYRAKWNPDLPESLTVRSKVQTAVTLTLHFIANPYPTNIVWFHPNQKTAIGENFTPTTINDKTYTLSKTSVRSSDYGNYTVRVTNAVGVSSFVFELKHTGPPQTPCCLKKVNATAISVTLTFKSNDNGGTLQTFTIERREPGGDWIVSAKNLADPGFNTDVVQKIAELKSNLMYAFRVKAVNDDGDSGYGNLLEVKTPATPNTTLTVSREGWVATVTWKALKRSYSKVQIKYCQREKSTACSYYHLKDPTATTASFDVDFIAIYDVYLEVFDGVDMVYRSAPVVLSLGVNVWIIVGVGVAVVILIAVVVVVVLRRRKKACFSDQTKGKAATMDNVTGMSEITGPDDVVPVQLYVNVVNSGFQEDADSWFDDDSEFDEFPYDVNQQRVEDQNRGKDATMNSVTGMSEPDAVAHHILYVNVDHSAFQGPTEDADSWVDEAEFDEFQYDVRVQDVIYGKTTTPKPESSGRIPAKRLEDLSVHDFKQWLLSKRVTKSTYKLLAKNGLKQASIFALLKPAHVEELKIKPLGQKILVQNLVKCFQQGIESKSSKIRLKPSGYEDGEECEEMDNPYVELNITHVASRTFTELKQRLSSVT